QRTRNGPRGRMARGAPIVKDEGASGTLLFASLARFLRPLRWYLVKHFFERREFVGFTRGLVPADATDARKAHGDAGPVTLGALQSLEGDFENQPEVRARAQLGHGAEAL